MSNKKISLEDIKIWWPLILFILVTLLGFLFLYVGNDEDAVSQVYSALDTASAVALAILASVAYFQYAREKSKSVNYMKQLEEVSILDDKDAFLGIQFGGGNAEAILEMENFAKQKGINPKLIITKKFGDEKNHVSEKDIETLENYLIRDVMPFLTGAEKVHLTVAGVGVVFFVCADILSNWKPLIVYQRNHKGEYEKWYSDRKHRKKIEPTMKDIQS